MSSEESSQILDEYIAKRDFTQTSEPKAVRESNDSGDFMVHLHDATRKHYDLRLQWKGVLKCWAIPKGPSYNSEDKRLAVRTEDHPDEYKAFEGVIPEGNYGAGPSLMWDAGEFIPREDFEKGLKKGRVKILLDGIKLKGKWTLIRMNNDSGNKEQWLMIKEHDEFENSFPFKITDYEESVASGRTLHDLVEEKKKQLRT